MINERLGNRAGLVGRMFKPWEIGAREYSAHSFGRLFRIVNFFWVSMFAAAARMRPVGSRFFGLGNGPLNYPGLFIYGVSTLYILARCRFNRSREQYVYNQ